jgi:preprotein translocase subunit SecF
MDVLNASINETLSRTVLTGGSSLATLAALFFFGGPVIRNFAWVLILGIIVGTFSSIFVAAPALYEIERRWPHQPKRVRGRMAPSTANRVRSPA